MRCLRRILWAITVAGLLATPVQAEVSVDCPNDEVLWFNKAELQDMLQAHREWVAADGWSDPTIPGRANLCNANLVAKDLSGADLSWADLSETNLSRANLSGVNLSGADLSGADLSDATLRDARGLSTLRWRKLPSGIAKIRKDFKDAGDRERERELTYAIKHNERINTGVVEGAFNYVLFEITSKYGLLPGRPLRILGGLILVMALPYWAALYFRRGTAGIWQIWPEDRTLKDQGSKEPVRLPERKFDIIWLGVYFSILSAFHIGWRDLNVGNWLTRLQPREYTLRATGWVRVASGVQSLVSVYLLALWALTYFARPFE